MTEGGKTHSEGLEGPSGEANREEARKEAVRKLSLACLSAAQRLSLEEAGYAGGGARAGKGECAPALGAALRRFTRVAKRFHACRSAEDAESVYLQEGDGLPPLWAERKLIEELGRAGEEEREASGNSDRGRR